MAEATENLGQLAVKHGFITPEQLKKSQDLQRSSANSPLGQILKDLGYLNATQLRFLEERQTQTIRDSQALSKPSRTDLLFGRLVLQRGYSNDRQLTLGRERKALLKSQGQKVHLGEVLVEMGFLTNYQLRILLSKRTAQVLFCAKCNLLQKVYAIKEGYRVRCDKCRSVMRSATEDPSKEKIQDTYFDEERSEFVGYIGRVAMKEGFLDQEQVVVALQHQAAESPEKTLERVFVELGFMDEEKLARFQAEHERSLSKKEAKRKRKLKESHFGEAAIQLDLTHEDFVKEALAKQAKKREEGIKRRLGTVMVDQGDLTPLQVVRVLEAQGKRIARCPDCCNQFNVAAEKVGGSDCPSCHKKLAVVEDAESIEIQDDLAGVPGQLAVIDLGDERDQDPETGRFADDSVTHASRSLRRFYKQVGLLDEALDTDTASTREPGTRKPITVFGTSKLEVRRAELSGKAAEARTRNRWTIPLVMGLVLLGSVVFSTVGFLLTREPHQPKVGLRDQPIAEPSPPLELVDGVRIEAYGVIPLGGLAEISDVSEHHQAFLFHVREGEDFWAVDLSGQSFDRLQFLGIPNRDPKPVHLRAVFQSKAPIELHVPVRAVKGYLVLEDWQVLHANALPAEDAQRLFAAPPKVE